MADRATEVELLLLRGFELRCDGEIVDVPMSARRVLAFLALHERQLARSYVAGTLWPDMSEARAFANLRTALWRLRQPEVMIIAATTTHLKLAPTVRVDVRDLQATAGRILGAGPWDSSEIEVADLGGELLPDFWDSWLVIEREKIRQVELLAFERLAVRLIEEGDFGRAVLVALAAIEAEPLRESANHVLIRAHIAAGNRVEAVRQLARYTELLASELQALPPAHLARLVEPELANT